METYNITVEPDNLLRLRFGDTPAQNDVLVKEAAQKITELIEDRTIKGGTDKDQRPGNPADRFCFGSQAQSPLSGCCGL